MKWEERGSSKRLLYSIQLLIVIAAMSRRFGTNRFYSGLTKARPIICINIQKAVVALNQTHRAWKRERKTALHTKRIMCAHYEISNWNHIMVWQKVWAYRITHYCIVSNAEDQCNLRSEHYCSYLAGVCDFVNITSIGDCWTNFLKTNRKEQCSYADVFFIWGENSETGNSALLAIPSNGFWYSAVPLYADQVTKK